jgi:hypothetical protein
VAGRVAKLTPELREKFCGLVRDGNYMQAACAGVGISFATFRNWYNRGRKALRGPYLEFFEAVRLAQAESEANLVKNWQAQVPENWQAARDFLARRFPARWGPKDSHDVSLSGKAKGGAIPIVAVEVVTGVRDDRPDRAEAGPVGGGGPVEVQLPPGPEAGVGE